MSSDERRRETPAHGADRREEQIPPLIKNFARDEGTLLGIRITRARSGQQRRLMQMEERSGYFVHEGEIELWRWSGTIEDEGYLYATFSDTGDIRPMEELAELSPEHCLSYTESLFYAYSLLRREYDESAEKIIPEAVFFDSSYGWHVLPPSLASVIAEELKAETVRLRFAGYSPRERLVGTSLLHLYRSLTGHAPYEENEEVPAHPYLYCPDMWDECARLIYLPFSEGKIPETEEVSRTVSRCRRESWREAVRTEEMEERRRRARESLHREARRLRFSRTVRTYAPPIGLGLAAVFVLLFLFSPLRGGRGEDPTVGLPPRDVIRLYYESMNRLDHQTMDACIAGSPGSQHMNEVTTLYVIARIRKGVEHTESFMSVDEWEEKGRPPLSNYTFVYGVSDIRIEEKSKIGGEKRSYEVRFLKYSTLPAETRTATNTTGAEESARDIESTGVVEISRMVERLTLERKKDGNWDITELETVESKVKEHIRPGS